MLIDPQKPTKVKEMRLPTDFRRAMRRRAERGADTRVRVVIQLKFRGVSAAERQVGLLRAIREVTLDGGTEREALEHAAEVTNRGEDAGWVDYTEFWAGDFETEEPQFPAVGLLEKIEEKTGASDSRAQLRTVT